MARKKAVETTAETVKTAAKTTAKAATAATKSTAAKVAEKVAEVKETATAKKPARKTPGRKPAVKSEVFVQYWGKEISTEEVVQAIKNLWTGEMGKEASALKDIKVYIKPEDNGAHYVLNGEITGFIEL